MLRTPCTSTSCWAFSIRLSLLLDQSSRGAAVSTVSPAAARSSRRARASWRRRTVDPLRALTSPAWIHSLECEVCQLGGERWETHLRTTRCRPPVPTLTSMYDYTARFLAAAAEIARMPGVWERLRAEHIPRPDGRCRGCYSARGATPGWPCRIRGLADQAADLSAASRPRHKRT